MMMIVLAHCGLEAGLALADPTPEPTAAPGEPAETPAEPPASDKPVEVPAETQAPTPLTSEEVKGAPRPGTEHGRLDQIDPGDSGGRRFGRALLWSVRLPFELVLQPVRGALYIRDRRENTEIGPDEGKGRSIAIAPNGVLETGLGANFGLRVRITDLVGAGERIDARLAYGGSVKPIATLGIEAGAGRVTAGVVGTFEIAEQPFHGYGNGEATQPAMPIDPLTSDAQASTQFEARMFRVAPHVRARLPHHVSLTAMAAVSRRSFEADDDDDELRIDEAFMTDRLPGFEDGITSLYSELEVAFDSRRKARLWDAPGMKGTGGLAALFVGRFQGLEDGDPGFFRLGIDLERIIPLTIGPRVLTLRAYGEVVTGSRAEVPFTDLPRLGGSSVLRGYAVDRFRDRGAAVVQATYRWRAGSWLAPMLFADVGRVFAGLDDLSLDNARVGFGAAVELYTDSGTLVRTQIASSIDGGVFLYLALGPAVVSPSRGGR